MAKIDVPFTAQYDAVMKILTGRGLLVGSYDPAGKGNLMTIGWGSIGAIWGIPIWTVLVRPSRYTYACIEHSQCFTVNVPTEALTSACGTCGSKSGRTMDKFTMCKLTARRGERVKAPIVTECPIVYECQVVHSNDVQPAKLAGEIMSGAYVSGDFHRVYYGKILAVHISPDAEKLLRV